MKQYLTSLWQPVNNVQLIVFRILFGLVMAGECVHDLTSGMVTLLYVDNRHNFTFIGFDWLSVLHGPAMYVYFSLMALCAFFVAAGLFYRVSSFFLATLWTGFYLSHKTQYNNHHYLILLLCWIMVFMPASRRFSADVKLSIARPRNECYRWQLHLFIFQMACVYFFAGIAKINADWLHAMPLKAWLPLKSGRPVIGHIMRNPVLPWLIAYSSLFFDLLVVPGLLYKPSRMYFFVLLILFHSFNGYVFSIGSFPFLSMSLVVFFFPGGLFSKLVPPRTGAARLNEQHNDVSRKLSSGVLVAYAGVQLFLPVRHWFITGPANWTEEGHRMSWQMMLRAKSGTAFFKIVDNKNDSTWRVEPAAFLHKSQINEVAGLPDITWQAANYLKDGYNKQGMDVSVYCFNYVRLNYRPARLLIDTSCDLAHTKWSRWGHNKWILLYPD